MSIRLIGGDCRDVLATLPANSVHCVVTSPPYYGLRDYGVDRQIGLEPTPDAYLAEMVRVFREVRRVMRHDAVAFINMGDSYQDKQLLMMPARLALALQADGWWLRSDIIWHKPNPMPESVSGSHVTRHMITVSDYERLSSVSGAGKCANEDGAGDVPSVPARQISNRQASVSADSQGNSHSQSTGRTSGSAREAPAVLGIGAGPSEPSEIRGDAQGQGDPYQAVSEISGQSAGQGCQCSEASADERQPDKAGAAPSGQQPISANRQGQGAQASGTCQTQGSDPFDGEDADCGGMEDGSASSQGALLLLCQGGEADDRPCDPAVQGRTAYQNQRRPGLPAVQLQEEQSTDPARLVACPGCDKCVGGYITRLSAGRPTSSHEHVFLLAKAARYFYDADAVRETMTHEPHPPRNLATGRLNSDNCVAQSDRVWGNGTRNMRNVWTLPTHSFPGAHFATFPPALAERCIRAGTSERGCCAACGAPWVRVTERTAMVIDRSERTHPFGRTRTSGTMLEPPTSTTTGWAPSCACNADTVPCTVLDPFAGAGTTMLVADRLQRDAIGIELNPDYTRMAMDRCRDDAPLFAEPSPAPSETPETPRIRDLFA